MHCGGLVPQGHENPEGTGGVEVKMMVICGFACACVEAVETVLTSFYLVKVAIKQSKNNDK